MEGVIKNYVAGKERRYYCSDDVSFEEINRANENISKIPNEIRQDLNFMIDIDFISNSDRIEGNASMPIVNFLHNPNIKVLRSEGRMLNLNNPQDRRILAITSGETYDEDDNDYIEYLKDTNLVVFDRETNEEYYIETSGHLAGVGETINEARRAKRIIQSGGGIFFNCRLHLRPYKQTCFRG